MECSILSLLMPAMTESGSIQKTDDGAASGSGQALFGEVLATQVGKDLGMAGEAAWEGVNLDAASLVSAEELSALAEGAAASLLQWFGIGAESSVSTESLIEELKSELEGAYGTSEAGQAEGSCAGLLSKVVSLIIKKLETTTPESTQGAEKGPVVEMESIFEKNGVIPASLSTNTVPGEGETAEPLSTDATAQSMPADTIEDGEIKESLALFLAYALSAALTQQQNAATRVEQGAPVLEDQLNPNAEETVTIPVTAAPVDDVHDDAESAPAGIHPAKTNDTKKGADYTTNSEIAADASQEVAALAGQGIQEGIATISPAGVSAGTKTASSDSDNSRTVQTPMTETLYGQSKPASEFTPGRSEAPLGVDGEPETFVRDLVEKLGTMAGGRANENKEAAAPAAGGATLSIEGEGDQTQYVLRSVLKTGTDSHDATSGTRNAQGATESGSRDPSLTGTQYTMSAVTGDGQKPVEQKGIEEAGQVAVQMAGEELEADSNPAGTSDGEQHRQEHQFFTNIDRVASERLEGGQKNEGVRHSGVVTAADRFEKIAQQMAAGRSNGQDLTVKLDIGNNERVVVAMKDLGQTIAVEVKASHDGLISLLQSQKDAIVRELEGKDLRTNIYIDPNASGNPERRERRETARQGRFVSTPAKAEGFSSLLEVVA